MIIESAEDAMKVLGVLKELVQETVKELKEVGLLKVKE